MWRMRNDRPNASQKMDIAIIKQYGLGSLINVTFFKVVYKLKLKYFRKRIPQTWSLKNGSVAGTLSFESFYSRCCNQVDYIQKEAYAILDGKVTLFGENFSLDPIHGWLNDPVTGGQWNENAYFVEAPTQQEGLADVKYVLELNKFNHLVRVALAFYHTNDKKYTQFITNSIVGYRETVKPYRSVVQRIIMDMGFRIINLIQILLLCNGDKQFQHKTAPLINGIIFDQVRAIESFHTAKWFKTGNGTNHVIGEMVGVILGQLWLQNNGITNYSKEYKKEYAYLVEVLNRTIAPSGAYLEQSGNYSRLVSEFLVLFDLLRSCMGHQGYYKAYEEGRYRVRLMQYLRDISYNDYVPNFGDNDDARVLTAFKGKNEEIDYFIHNVNPTNRAEAYLDGSQWVYRSNDTTDIHLFVRVGKFAYFREGASIHAHNDLLAVLMGVKGHPVFIDKGMLFYNTDKDLRKSYSRMSVHNTINLEGIEMNRLGVGACFEYPQCEYVKGDIRGDVVFSSVLKYGNVEHKRKISYSKGFVGIKDEVNLKKQQGKNGTIHYLLHPDVKAEMSGKDVSLTLKDGSRVTITVMGIDALNLDKTNYSSAYGQTKNTTQIIGNFVIDKNIVVITNIRI